MYPPAPMQTMNLERTVEDFVRANGLDERAADALRGCAPHVLHAVLERGDLAGAHNASSAVIGRIKDAQNAMPRDAMPGPSPHGPAGGRDSYAMHGGWGPPPTYPSAPTQSTSYLGRSVEDFIRANDLDERAADALRSCTPHVLQVVLERGDLAGVRNPSSAVLGRIKDAQNAMPRDAMP